MKPYLSLVLLILINISSPSCVSQNSIKNDTVIESFIAYSYDNKIFNGSVVVIKNDTMVYKQMLGYQDFNKKKPLSKESKFLIASISKPFTALAIMQLKEKQLLDYDDTLDNYFKEFPEYAQSITIRHLLNHTSGISNHYDLGMQKNGMTNNDVLRELIKHELLFEPGTEFKYSNSGYILLAMLIEKVSKLSFRTYLSQNIFAPLGMKNTEVKDETHPNISNMVDGISKYGETHNYPFFTTGSTGIYSTIDDLLLFDKALYSNTIIKQETLKEAHKLVAFNNDEISDYGFGWHIVMDKNNTLEKTYHTAGAAGYTGLFFRDIKNKHTVIFMANNRQAFNLGAFASGLTGYLYGKEIVKPKIPISIKLNDTLNQNKAIDIKSIFNTLKEKTDIYTINEDDLNEYGYYLLGEGSLNFANTIFKVNTELFSKSWNTFDSYAESFLKLNDTLNAKKYYMKALKMNPEIKNPEEELKKIFNK